MSNGTYDAIVIGAGPNGLMSAAYLAKSGAKVLLLERRHETGGGLNTDEYFGYRLNLHAVYHMMGEAMPAHHDLDLPGLGVRYLYPDPVAAFPRSDGGSLILRRDPAANRKAIAELDASDGDAFDRMWADFAPMLDRYLVPMTYDLPEPALDQMVAFEETAVGHRLAEISELTFDQVLDEYGFRDSRVRMALLALPAMWGLHLHDPLGYLYPLYVGRMLGAGLVKGGSHRLSSAMYRAFLRAGGVVEDASEVSRIVVRDGVAVGVEIADGRSYEARTVISTLNPEQTFVDLIEPAEVPDDLAAAVAAWEWEERTMFGLHLGISGDVRFRATDPAVNESMIVFCGIEEEGQLYDHLERVDNGTDDVCEWIHATVPTRFDATMAPAGHSLVRVEAVVGYDRPWAENGEAFADGCIELLGRYADMDDIVFRRHVTPLDIEARLTTMKRGSIKHGAYSPLQMGYLRPNDLCSRSTTPIEGLFVGGASMYPGGMVLGGPGYIAAGVVAEDLGLEFATSRQPTDPGAE